MWNTSYWMSSNYTKISDFIVSDSVHILLKGYEFFLVDADGKLID